MRFRTVPFFNPVDPVVAVNRSRSEADSCVATLRRAGFGDSMLAVVARRGSMLDAVAPDVRADLDASAWIASSAGSAAAWTVFTVAMALLLPTGNALFAALVPVGTLALLLQTALGARVMARAPDGLQGSAPASALHPGADLESADWHFLVVVRGSRSDIALANDILAAR